jgi:cell filamentation protein, protein adenylyltransferase
MIRNPRCESNMEKPDPQRHEMAHPTELDLSEAVNYHYDKFPPSSLDYNRLVAPLLAAASSLTRYDQMLRGMHNSAILLAPLRSQEAVVSSRMEGTISTLDEVLRYGADEETGGEREIQKTRSETIEVYAYQLAMRRAQKALEGGQPFSEHLIRATHATLLAFGRGTEKNPGKYKTEQNYIGETGRRKISFVPINPLHLNGGMQLLMAHLADEKTVPLIRTALSHVEFEALHPFEDGNGRVGRMMITLLLWHLGVISEPHFYVSGCLEENRDEYINSMRSVSENDDWTSWAEFFLNMLDEQAKRNIQITEQIMALYEEMKHVFREKLNSQWATQAQDFMFENPTFRNNRFTSTSGIPKPTAVRISRTLHEEGILKQIIPASGRSPAMFSFEPLLEIVRRAG